MATFCKRVSDAAEQRSLPAVNLCMEIPRAAINSQSGASVLNGSTRKSNLDDLQSATILNDWKAIQHLF